MPCKGINYLIGDFKNFKMPQADSEEQYSLKWNDYQTNLTNGFQHLLEEEIMLDVSLSAGGKLIQAHKLILSICSPYFKGLFQV